MQILADWLISECDVTADVGVGIYMGRSIEYVIAYIAILKAGEKLLFKFVV